MINKRIIPLQRIEKNSKVIIYGAGTLGRQYVQQNKCLGWCDILFAVDINYFNIADFPIKLCSPNSIDNSIEYNYVIIAIASPEERYNAKRLLLHLGVSSEKIIDEIDCYYWDRYEINGNKVNHNIKNQTDIRIGILFTGGLGDQIMQLCIYQKLIEVEEECVIDVIVPHKRLDYAKCVFFNQKNLGKIMDGNNIEKEYDNYTLVLKVDYEIEILKFDYEFVKRKSSSLLNAIMKLQEYNKQEFLGLPLNAYSMRIKIDRAKFENRNHYTMYRQGNVFDITDQRVRLKINNDYVTQFKNLKLGNKYCTYNYGADDISGNGKLQTKLWPYEYHEKFNQLFKNEFPEIELVQLGGKNATRIPYADRYILGEKLEIVEHILKNSTLHIDCEGGLVHLATQLETKCCVLFGPTPAWFYGYPQNINIESTICGECIYMYEDWFTCCHRNGKAECMRTITPEIVMERIKQYLELEQ